MKEVIFLENVSPKKSAGKTLNEPELSIIIVNWNGMGFLPICLKSIANNPPSVPYEVIVVDNESTDGSIEWLGSPDAVEIFPKENLRAILNNENVGFGRANNVAIRNSTSEYVLVLNPDSIVKSGAIDRLLQTLVSNTDIGAVAPKLFNQDGTAQASVTLFPLNPITILALSLRLPRFLPKRFREKFFGEYWKHDEERVVPAFWGAAIMVKRKTIDEVGAFDEDFFMYGEDHEWCARINQGGWKTVYVPEAEIIHLGGRSSIQVWDTSEKELRMWAGDILAHKKSLPPIFAAANALTRAGIFSLGYVRRLVFRQELGPHAQLIKLQLDAVRDGFTKRTR